LKEAYSEGESRYSKLMLGDDEGGDFPISRESIEKGDTDWRQQIEKIEPRVRQIFEDVLDNYAVSLVNSLGVCESPIEQLMILALNSLKAKYATLTDDNSITIRPQTEINIGADSSGSGKPKESFRVDFLIIAKIGGKFVRVIVECDGHEFHEKNKEQATRDKRRARMLTLEGYVVLNYTGSEIWGNPFKCAREALGIMFKK
jgi:hypothetical protein